MQPESGASKQVPALVVEGDALEYTGAWIQGALNHAQLWNVNIGGRNTEIWRTDPCHEKEGKNSSTKDNHPLDF